MALSTFTLQGWAVDDIANPYPIYRRYRELDPVHQAAPDTWYVFGYDDIATVLSSKHFGRNGPTHLPRRHDALRGIVENWLVFMDPPRHTRLRRLLSTEFSPRVVTNLRPRIAGIARELVTALTDRTSIDLVEDFAAPYPVLVISELLGVPKSLRDWFRERAVWLQEASSARAGRRADRYSRADHAARELADYFGQQVRLRRRESRDDLVSLLAHAEGLSDDEIVGTCVHLLTAGHETTTNLLGKSVLALLATPDVLERLRADPELMPAAVDELIRYDSPVQMVTRWAYQEQVLGGREIHRGHKVVLVLGSANRDPHRFPVPDELRLDRDASRHCGFGIGIHYCLGAALARAEAEIGLTVLLENLSAFALTDEPIHYGDDMVFHGPTRLSLQVSRVR
jgi:cytochrome P450